VHWVPESALLGLSAVVGAAYLRRLRRARSVARAARGDEECVAAPTEAAVGFEARLAPFADAPVLDWLEVANRHLTAALRSEERADEAPGVTVVRVGPGGVELLLDTPVDWAPGSFTLADEGHTWLLGPEVDRVALWREAGGELAWLPLLLPLGDDVGGTYVLHLAPGQAVQVEGPGADAMLGTWVTAAKAWPWAEQVGLATDAATAESLAPLFRGQVGAEERATLMFTGQLAEMSSAARGTVATVSSATVAGEPGEALTQVVVTSERAYIEPFGITVRPCLLSAENQGALAGFLAGNPLLRADEVNPDGARGQAEPARERPPGADIVGPGPIEVRLLTFTPQIVGLAQPLPTSLAVRVTELVAWVALQGQKGTTSAAMLDLGIVGATATKTLYNMVSAARLALGTDASGVPLLISERATGHLPHVRRGDGRRTALRADGPTGPRQRGSRALRQALPGGPGLDQGHTGGQWDGPLRLVGQPVRGPYRAPGHQVSRPVGRAGPVRRGRSRVGALGHRTGSTGRGRRGAAPGGHEARSLGR